MSWQNTMGQSTLQNVFETLLRIRWWQTLTSLSEGFLPIYKQEVLASYFDTETSELYHLTF